MSTENATIINGGVGNVTSLLSNEINANYGVPEKSAYGGNDYRSQTIKKAIYSHVNREFLPIQKVSTVLEGISKAVTSFPNAVARSGATAPPIYKNISPNIHGLIYNKSRDVADLNDTESSILESILKQEMGDGKN